MKNLKFKIRNEPICVPFSIGDIFTITLRGSKEKGSVLLVDENDFVIDARKKEIWEAVLLNNSALAKFKKASIVIFKPTMEYLKDKNLSKYGNGIVMKNRY